MAQQAAETAKTVGEVNSAGVMDVMNQFTGYGSPSAVEVGAL